MSTPGSKSHIFDAVDRYVVLLSKIFNWIAGAGLVAMLVLVVADIIGIKVFSRPVPGGIEIVSFLAVVAIGFAVAYTQIVHGQVSVDFVVDRFPRRVKFVVAVFTGLLSITVMALLAWYSFRYAGLLRASGEVSMTQNIPFYPFVYGLAACFVVAFLVLALELTKTIRRAVTQWTR